MIDAVYETPAFHNNPMEPHATTAMWEGDDLVLYDSNQGVPPVRAAVAEAFGLVAERVRVISPHVGGGFGSKGTPRPHVILAAMAARAVERPVKVAVTRQQMFAFVGYRTPTIQRLRLGAGEDGRLTAMSHEVAEQTSTCRRVRRADGARHADDVRGAARRDPPPRGGARRPDAVLDARARRVSGHVRPRVRDGRARGRVRDRPDRAADPQRARRRSRDGPALLQPWPGRVHARGRGDLRLGDRALEPRGQRDGAWLVGMGVAASTYPARRRPSEAAARAEADGTYTVRSERRTSARAPARCCPDRRRHAGGRRRAVRVEIGDTRASRGAAAGGSMGPRRGGRRWRRRARLRQRMRGRDAGVDRAGGSRHAPTRCRARGSLRSPGTRSARSSPRSRVDTVTGEVRVPRLLGVFAAGRILNPRTARSQLIGGMTMGLSMALHEESVMDRALRRLRQPRLRLLPHRRVRGRPGDRGALDRRAGRAPQPDGVEGHRRDRHRRHRRRDRERGLPRDGHPRPRPADPAGQAAAVKPLEGWGVRRQARPRRTRASSAR